MSKTPAGIVATQMPTLETISDTIETNADIFLEANYRGKPVEFDIEEYVSSVTQPERIDIIIELVKIKYPKWKIDFGTYPNTTRHRFLTFNAKDFS